MRTSQEIEEEIQELRKLEKETIIEFLKGMEMDKAVQIANISSVLCFASWLYGQTEMKFSTLINITEVSKRGLMAGVPVEDIMEFSNEKIKEYSKKKAPGDNN